MRTQSSSSTMSRSPTAPQSPLPEFDHTSSLLALSPHPIYDRASPSPFRGNLVPLISEKALQHEHREHPNAVRTFLPLSCTGWDSFLQPFSLPRAFKDDQGQKPQPGLKDLPNWLHEDFRNLFIRHIIEQVCSSQTPWNNPPLQSLQRELNHVYPTHRIRLHSDDAAVVPVSHGHLLCYC